MQPTLDPFDLPARLVQNYDRVERILVRLESGLSTEAAIDRVKIEAVAEIRQNMILAQKALEISLQAAAARQFEQIVIDTLAQQTPRIRKQLIGKLNEARHAWQPATPATPESEFHNPQSAIRNPGPPNRNRHRPPRRPD